MTQLTVGTDKNLLPIVDKAIENVKDNFGLPKFKSRAQFVAVAVKDLLEKECKNSSVKLQEA